MGHLFLLVLQLLHGAAKHRARSPPKQPADQAAAHAGPQASAVPLPANWDIRLSMQRCSTPSQLTLQAMQQQAHPCMCSICMQESLHVLFAPRVELPVVAFVACVAPLGWAWRWRPLVLLFRHQCAHRLPQDLSSLPDCSLSRSGNVTCGTCTWSEQSTTCTAL